MLDDDGSLLPGLLPGMYRGITFHVPNTSIDAGRRVVEYLFPGVDPAAYDDFGKMPGVVYLSGLIIADDYRERARALEAAFAMPGPATLIHPWRGPMTVIMMEPGQIVFSERELRVLRFSAVFKIVERSTAIFASALGPAVTNMIAAASAIISAVDGVISATRTRAVTRSNRVLTTAISGLPTPAGSRRFLPRLITSANAVTPSSPQAFDALVTSTAALFGAAAQTPAVSPAAEAASEPAPTALSLMTIGASLTESLIASAASAPSDADRALISGSAAHYLAQVAAQSSYAEFTSRQEAQGFRGRAVAAIDGLTEVLDGFAGAGFAAEASGLMRATRSLQTALIGDINEVIGRLPSVLTFRPIRPLDAWLLAQHVFGDTPELIEAGYADIIARNRPRHPADLPAGDIEVLDARSIR